MLTAADATRRSVGLFFLLLACVIVIWGQTVLKPHLTGVRYMIYWAVCFLCLGISIFTAVIDALIVRRRIRLQHEQLLKRTLMEIELELSGLPQGAKKDAPL